MRIGIKLNVGYAAREPYRRLYGARDVPVYLCALGIAAAETPVGPDTDPDAMAHHVEACTAAGMRVSLHPYTEGTPFNPAGFETAAGNPCRTMHERFFRHAAEAAQAQRAEAVVNIHAAAGPPDTPRAELLEQSVRFFAWARDFCAEHAPGAMPVVELQFRPGTDEPIQRIGDGFDELLDVVQHSGCGACWDFGHSYMNHVRFGMAPEPTDSLLPHFVHVHCHDADEEDHQPLLFGKVPWQRNLRTLAGAGFDGTVVLEVPPEHFLPLGGSQALERSVAALRGFMQTIGRLETRPG